MDGRTDTPFYRDATAHIKLLLLILPQWLNNSFYFLDSDTSNDLGEALDRAFASIPQLQTGENIADDLVAEEEDTHVIFDDC